MEGDKAIISTLLCAAYYYSVFRLPDPGSDAFCAFEGDSRHKNSSKKVVNES